jgi:hypothetical protein
VAQTNTGKGKWKRKIINLKYCRSNENADGWTIKSIRDKRRDIKV